jgi:hypothetical protein
MIKTVNIASGTEIYSEDFYLTYNFSEPIFASVTSQARMATQNPPVMAT